MNNAIQEAIDNLKEVVASESADTVVSFRLFISAHQSEVDFETRTPDQLKASGTSMRNLRGDFIK